jgi:hypothetical protein
MLLPASLFLQASLLLIGVHAVFSTSVAVGVPADANIVV